MSSEANKALVRAYLTAVDTGDIAILDEYIAPEYVDHNPQPVPNIDPGLPGLKQAFPVTHAAFRDFRHEIEFQVAERDLVANRIHATGVQVDAYLGVPATQKRVDVTAFSIYRVRDGRLVEHWAIADGLNLLQQFGFLPTRQMFPPTMAPGHSSSTAARGSTRPEDARAAVRRWYGETLDTHRLERAAGVLADDFLDCSEYLLAEADRGGEVAFWREFYRAFPDARIAVEETIVDGDTAVVRWTIQGAHGGPFMGMAATGRPFMIGAIDALRFDGQRIAERVGEIDTLALLFQLGAMQPPAPPESLPGSDHAGDPLLAGASPAA
jgi:predicted ester cyclase